MRLFEFLVELQSHAENGLVDSAMHGTKHSTKLLLGRLTLGRPSCAGPILTAALFLTLSCQESTGVVGGTADPGDQGHKETEYPADWWQPVPASEKAWWEILPQSAAPGEVILSKRNELGLLSNFAATPFSFRGKHYASLEGLWQAMKYPETPDDPRALYPGLTWEHTREEVMNMVAFEANEAGQSADANMATMGIDWITFEGERIRFQGDGQARHREIIESATWTKVRQNPQVRKVLLSTGDLILKPDHITGVDDPPAWRYYEIYMKIRTELRHLQTSEGRPPGAG